MIQIGLIGISGYGEVHYNDLLRFHEAGKARFAAAAVINQSAEAVKCDRMRSLGVELFSDYRAMLDAWNGRLDLVCIPTGIAFHASMACDAMRAGAHALIEKPAAATVAEVGEMRRVETETGKTVSVGFQDIYRPEFQRLKQRLLDGLIGKLRSVTVRAVAPAARSYYARNNWAGKLFCGGRAVYDSPFNNSNAHQLNLALFLAGKSNETSAFPDAVAAELYRASERIDSADTGSVSFHAGNTAFFCAMSRAASERETPEIVLYGEKGTVIVHPDRILLPDGSSEAVDLDYPRSRNRLLDSVIDRIGGGSSLCATLEIAGAHTRLVTLMHQCAEVRPVRREWVETVMASGECYDTLRNISAILKQATAERKMLSQLAAFAD